MERRAVMGDVTEIRPGVACVAPPEKAIDIGYQITEEEHGDLMESLFQVESIIRILEESCSDKGNRSKENQPFLDVANCLIMAQDKLKYAMSLLDK